MRNVKEPEERKKEIIDTAERLFYTKGYAKTKITDIIEEMGMSKGIFYYYFKSKEEVMDAIITRVIDEDVAAVQIVANDNTLPVHEKVMRVLTTHHTKITENNRRFLSQITDVENPEILLKTIQQGIERLSPILVATVRQGIEEGVFQSEFPQETIELLLSAYTFQCLFRDQGKATPKAKAFISVLEKALCAETASFDYLLEILLHTG
jgi:AcrR family transcriptional regulator